MTDQQHNETHTIEAVINLAKHNLKTMIDNQTELDKQNKEYQSIKDEFTSLLEIEPSELTPQEFSRMVELNGEVEQLFALKVESKDKVDPESEHKKTILS